jgi:uncharacterized DUF497 family protein
MSDGFRWNDWNREHATKHGCSVAEIESVVCNRSRPWPRKAGDEKWVVEGRGQGGRVVRVMYLIDDPDKTYYVIHAMPLTTRRRR